MASVTVILYEPVIQYMRGWSGDIGRAVHRLAEDMAVAQRVMAPRKTGHLWGSISVGDRGHGPRGITIDVGANPGMRRYGYAYWTDQGARPHRIVPRAGNKRGLLIFYWARVGHVVRFRSVNHPGIRNPSHWAERGAEVAVRSWS